MLKSNLIQRAQDEDISSRFSKGEPALVRTLRYRNDTEATKDFGVAGKTPAKREADTLANRITGKDIVIIPSSVVISDVKANTMSLMEVPHRPKWKGLPSLIALPASGQAEGLTQISKRLGFGDIHTHGSSKGFDNEYADASPLLSHAEKLQLLERKARRYMKADPDRQSYEFSHSLEELVESMRTLQSKRPGQVLRHNEYCAKLELWDMRALEAGKSPPMAIATLLEFNLEMSDMARELAHEGSGGPRLTEFLGRQMSWSESGTVKDLASTLQSLHLVSTEERERILNSISSHLRKGISLCTYEHEAEGSKIRALSLKDFTAGDILAGLELFLSTKLLHLPSSETAMLSRATIDGKPYQTTEHTPAAIRQFLSQSLSNNRYDSVAHLQHRAEVYLEYIEAEKTLIKATSIALQDSASPVVQQSGWMAHLERGLWKSESVLENMDRQQLGNEALGTATPSEGSPYFRPRSWQLSPDANSAFAMMLKGEAGPFTEDQSKAGFEVAQEGQLMAGRLKIADRMTYRVANRHDASRSRTHVYKTPGGLDLSQDAGTRLRDELNAPVMTGTSGSASDVALATKFGAQYAQASWAAAGLTEDEAKTAMTDLALHFFRSKGSSTSPPALLAKGMNSVRHMLGLPAKEVEATQVFTHSYPEVHAGISLTIDGADPSDKEAIEHALVRSIVKAKERLSAVVASSRHSDGGPGSPAVGGGGQGGSP